MFLKVFFVFSCVVLYTASKPTPGEKSCIQYVRILEDAIPKINCSNSYIQKINFTRPTNLYETHQDMFCQIRKALNNSSCSKSNTRELQKDLREMQGNVSCTLLDTRIKTNMEEFLGNLNQYLISLRNYC